MIENFSLNQNQNLNYQALKVQKSITQKKNHSSPTDRKFKPKKSSNFDNLKHIQTENQIGHPTSFS